MKVILIKDVARLGRRSEVKEVPAGHAQNFLIPRRLAIPATPENMKRLGAEISKHTASKEDSEREFREALVVLKDQKAVHVTDANEQGHLFKGVNAHDIAGALQKLNLALSDDDVVLSHPIKSLGLHEVTLTRGTQTGVCTLEIVKK